VNGLARVGVHADPWHIGHIGSTLRVTMPYPHVTHRYSPRPR
jgi:hypothetical protein